jgi:hypothetical protein
MTRDCTGVSPLLHAQAEIGSFHQAPAPTVDQPIPDTAGTVIGLYKLLEPIGEGGKLKSNQACLVCPAKEYQDLVRQLLQIDSAVRQQLEKSFSRVVILDAEAGLDPMGRFNVDRFFHYAVEQLVRSFDLALPQHSYFPEDIAQILKDEPECLLCFLNVHVVPLRLLVRLRGFTQERHQALFLEAETPKWLDAT